MTNKKSITSLNNYLFERYGFNLLCLFLLFIPLKLSIAYIFFFPLVLSGLTYLYQQRKIEQLLEIVPSISKYWIFFILSLLASGSFGLEPLKSYRKVLELLFYSSSILVIYEILKTNYFRPLIFLIIGQAIAASYSILEFFNPTVFKQLFIGAVSESGQIAATIFIAFACFVEVNQKSVKSSLRAVLLISLLLIFTALILNMKRGPMLGVAVAGSFLFLAYRPKMLIVFIPMLILPVMFISTIRQRLLDSFDHFLISGGRYDIWEIGIELAGRFPLGIGFANSRHLQDYSSVIPSNLKHFHNNYLNILVEGGVLSLLLFSTFFIILLYQALKAWRAQNSANLILLASISALISWMVAGLVEYSFGDSEVMLIIYLVISMVILKMKSAFDLSRS